MRKVWQNNVCLVCVCVCVLGSTQPWGYFNMHTHTYLRCYLFTVHLCQQRAEAAAWEMEANSVLSLLHRGSVLRCKQFLWESVFPSVFITSGKVVWRVFPQEWQDLSVTAPHLPPLLTLSDDMGLIAASAQPLCPAYCLGINCTRFKATELNMELPDTVLSLCEVAVIKVEPLL